MANGWDLTAQSRPRALSFVASHSGRGSAFTFESECECACGFGLGRGIAPAFALHSYRAVANGAEEAGARPDQHKTTQRHTTTQHNTQQNVRTAHAANNHSGTKKSWVLTVESCCDERDVSREGLSGRRRPSPGDGRPRKCWSVALGNERSLRRDHTPSESKSESESEDK